MKVIGLTGSIAMGKTTTANFFKNHGVPVFDADRVVRNMQDMGGEALPMIDKAFNGVVKDGILDRSKLRNIVFSNLDARKKLENIIHPLVEKRRQIFLKEAETAGAQFVIIDSPLLFETGADKTCDSIIVVTASKETQKQRLSKRTGITEDMADQMIGSQLSDQEKRSRADYIIDTGLGFDHGEKEVEKLIKIFETME